MNATLKSKYLISSIFLLFLINSVVAQFTIDAGVNQIICPKDSAHLGGAPTAFGGKPPYTYLWTPATGLSSATVANPSAAPPDLIVYGLTVTDDTGAVQTASVNVSYFYTLYVNAGLGIDFCLNGSGVIGGPSNIAGSGQGVSYSWSPLLGLNDSTLPQPAANPLVTTTYTLTSTITGCPPKIDSVVVTVIQPPPINAGADITIKEGETVTLHATGGYNYLWTLTSDMLYNTTANPDVQPIVATNYYLYGTDKNKRCHANDTITVFVEPSSDVVFYNTFTPNHDGNNDTFYIGNINKYPHNRLEIYNRNGKLVYQAEGYSNTWDGKSFLGEELPPATYFYMMDLGDGAGSFHGTVTIVK
jgi:gliding motility-associated-like protein